MGEKLLPALCQPSGILISMCDLAANFCDTMHLCYCPGIFDPASAGKASELSMFFLSILVVDSEFMETPQPPSGSKKKKKKLY